MLTVPNWHYVYRNLFGGIVNINSLNSLSRDCVYVFTIVYNFTAQTKFDTLISFLVKYESKGSLY